MTPDASFTTEAKIFSCSALLSDATAGPYRSQGAQRSGAPGPTDRRRLGGHHEEGPSGSAKRPLSTALGRQEPAELQPWEV